MKVILHVNLVLMKLYVVFSLVMTFVLPVFAQQKLAPVDAESKVKFVIKNFGINTNGELSGLKGTVIMDQKKVISGVGNYIANDNKWYVVAADCVP